MRSPLLVSLLLAIAGCAAGADDAVEASEDQLKTADLKKYGMSVGIVATAKEAQALHKAISENGGKDLGNHAVLAGLTALDLGLAKEGDKDASEHFGIVCQAAAGDSTFHADTCSITAVVEAEKQGAKDVTTLTGKLAKAVAQSLPRTSPAGLVGSATTKSGPVECKTIPGTAGSTCTVRAFAVFASFEEMMQDSGEGHISAADAKKVVLAFFPGA